MKLELPNLDDRTYTELVSEALAMLPRHAPEWTHHNPSDPGITLIELLAYFTEMLLYRLNRVSRETRIEFLQLLRGPGEDLRKSLADASSAEVDEEIRRTVLALREPQRAVTPADFEFLARRAAAGTGSDGRAARACCVARRNLEAGFARDESARPGHVSLVVVPDRPLDAFALAQLIDRVRDFVAPRCLLTTRLHVVGPCYVWLSASLVVRIDSRCADVEAVRQRIAAGLERHFGPYAGCGPGGEGWPFGRTVYLAEIAAAVEGLEEVECVEGAEILQLAVSDKILHDERSALGIQIGRRSTVGIDARLGANPWAGRDRVLRSGSGRLLGIRLRPHELVRVVVRRHAIRLAGLATPEDGSRAWREYGDVE